MDGKKTNGVQHHEESPPNGNRTRIDSVGSQSNSEERHIQREYWLEHSHKQGNSMENMMLDNSASQLDRMDRPEVLGLLPPYAGKRVLELASGIGRFTGVIGSQAESLVTVEFMEDFLGKNRELYGHMKNIRFICDDVLALDLEPSQFDIVFSCWLKMYLADEEVRELAARSLRWTKPGGYVFFRESCFRQSGDVARTFNPSHYRHPSFYTSLYSGITCEESDGSRWGFELVYCRNLETYVRVKGNKGQCCWLWRKVELKQIQEVGWSGAVAAEKILGDGFSTFGGRALSQELVKHLHLQAGQKALDLACGTGGSSRLMAEGTGVECWGVDGSMRAIEVALEKSMADPKSFLVLEACTLKVKDYPPETFDAIMAREEDRMVESSQEAVSQVKKCVGWLRPGGRMVLAAYCRAETVSGAFPTVDEYHQSLSRTNVAVIDTQDRTAQIVELMSSALSTLEGQKSKLLAELPSEEVEGLQRDWQTRLTAMQKAELSWVVLVVQKGADGAAAPLANGNH